MKKIDFDFTPSRILFLMTCICLALMAGTYFRSDSAVPVTTAIGYVIVPLQTGMNKIGGLFFNSYDTHKTMDELEKENEQLKEENERLRQQIVLAEGDKKELAELQRLLDMKESLKDYDVTGAKIISMNSENWYAKFTIDKGTDDGIEKNMVVVSGDGLVGIVTNASKTYSSVTSIIDDTMNVSAMSQTTNDTCIVKGNLLMLNEGSIEIRNINKDDVIHEGDAIVTSNISDYYLPGILIGYATDVHMDNNMLTQSGKLVPAVDFSNLDEVLVIKTLKENGK